MRVGVGVALAGLVLPMLAGCGSGTSATFTVSCTTRQMPSGMIRAAVTVTNSSSSPARAMVYGPIFSQIQHFYPPSLYPGFVAVKQTHGVASYPAFVLTHVRPNHPVHLLFRFARPPHVEDIAVTETRTVQAGASDPLSNTGCQVG